MAEGTGRFQKGVLMLAGLFLLGVGGRWLFFTPPLLECGPFDPPVQFELTPAENLAAPPGFTIEATDSYSVQALVVSAKRYSRGRESELSPIDLALAWGPLTAQQALDTVRYSQGNRWYFYKWKNSSELPVTPGEISNNSANTHIILPPDREDLHDFADLVSRGDTVKLSGYLVRVTATDGWRWNSSRSRTDSGAHSCEVFYVTEARIMGSTL